MPCPRPLRPPLLRLLLAAALLLPGAMAPGVLQAQEPSPNTPAALVARADALMAEGRIQEARDLYRDALRRDAAFAGAAIGMARTALAAQNWYEAAQHLEGVLAQDAGHLEARYYRAITHRELAKYRGLLELSNWGSAEEEFEWLLARDSLYRDVLYQYALLRRNGEAYTEALALGNAQVRLKPGLSEPQRGLFALYRSFLTHTPADEARAWMQANPGPYATFFTGELLRREGALREADTVFAGLLAQPPAVPRQPVLLARARVHYALGTPETAQGFVEQAIREIDDPAGAALVFEDFKYVFTDDELAHFYTLRNPADFHAFFDGFWARRNPLPAAPLNRRLAEHYRRLLLAEKEYAYDGLRSWHNNPDKMSELDFPRVYRLNDEYNDKGLIYIRHGEPAERIVTVAGEVDFFRSQTTASSPDGLPKDQSFEAGWVPNESWRYLSPTMDFHFVIDEGGGFNNWRLTPAVLNKEMVADREQWGGVYARLASLARTAAQQRERQDQSVHERVQEPSSNSLPEDPTSTEDEPAEGNITAAPPPKVVGNDPAPPSGTSMLDLLTFRDQMVAVSREAVALALSTDRHTWADDVTPLEVPYFTAAFRGPDGRTDLEIYFALPIGRLTREIGMDVNTVDVEVACAAFDAEWRPVATQSDVKQMPPVPDADAAVLDYCRLTVPPDSYHVAFHNRPVQTSRIGGYKFGLAVPDFSANRLAMSDLLPASSIRPTLGPSRFNKGDLYITANPFSRYPVRQPVFLYFEVYNLTFDAGDQTRYAVEYTLRPEASRTKRFRLFGGGDGTVLSLRTEHTGPERAPREYAEIDVRSVDPGRYVLEVRVTNVLTNESVVRTRPLELVEVP